MPANKENTADNKFIALKGGKLQSSERSFFISSDYQPSYDFPWNPDPIASGNNYNTYDEMREDDQVKAALSIKKDMVIGSGWEIDCEDEKIKDFVTKSLKECSNDYLNNSFSDFLRDILSAYDYGFSLSEVVYKLASNQYTIKSLKVRPPHTFKFHIDDYGNVIKIEQTGKAGAVMLAPEGFLHYAHNQEFGNPYGKSDLREAMPAWKAKKFFLRMFAMYAERFATPTKVARYKPEMSDDEISRLHDVIKSLQNNTTITLPEDLTVEFLQASKDGSTIYSDGIDMFNMWIARAILVPDLLGMSGSKTSGGSYSLGEKQFNLFVSTIKKDREAIADKITQRIIKPLVSANFGDIPCSFKFLEYSEDNMSEMLKIWVSAVSAKIYKPTEQEINHFRRSVKFPEGAVEIIEQPTPQPFNKPEEKKEFAEKKFSRELTPYEKKVNFAEAEKTLNSAEERILNGVSPIAEKIQADLVAQIINKKIIENFKPEKVNDIQPKFLKEMNQVFKTYFKELFNKSLAQAKKELFPSGTKHFIDSEIMPKEFLKILESESFKVVGDYSVDITKRAKNLLFKGIKDGLPEARLVNAIKDDIRSETERWLSTVVRTKTTEIYNAARKSYWDTDKIASNLVEAYEFSAIMDDRTSDVCANLDGKIFEKGDFADKITPPLHFNCRSILVPITRYEDYTPSKPISIETLKNQGGNLIAFADEMPLRNVSGRIVNTGNITVAYE